jgi:hypothetical protein
MPRPIWTDPGHSRLLRRRLENTANSFAGDESLVVKSAEPSVTSYNFVRSGPLVAQIFYQDVDGTEPVLIGQKAAERLCAGTTAC